MIPITAFAMVLVYLTIIYLHPANLSWINDGVRHVRIIVVDQLIMFFMTQLFRDGSGTSHVQKHENAALFDRPGVFPSEIGSDNIQPKETDDFIEKQGQVNDRTGLNRYAQIGEAP